MRTFAVSAVGLDRPGIIAGVAEQLVAHGVNVTDSRMGILRGHFAMTLVVTAPGEVDADALAADLRAAGDALELEALTVREVSDAGAAPATPTHTVVVHGADHPGILAATTSALAEAGVNVCDLQARLLGADTVYVILMEVAAPDGADLQAVLAPVGSGQGVEIAVRPFEPDVL
jgi:glycine cleavage system transcriptional repressor